MSSVIQIAFKKGTTGVHGLNEAIHDIVVPKIKSGGIMIGGETCNNFPHVQERFNCDDLLTFMAADGNPQWELEKFLTKILPDGTIVEYKPKEEPHIHIQLP